ncbi:uncharacterized protein LOC130649269 [Hydractinia symbiolongicarpus]|uniref:uncharacterized protein LOC130649269 n=1 Tax=Hydractinia symbiolongicarpus TaxID=13093 RepID=UPI00254CFBB3|nr:uncharacterized protein LOC130649269 [Hydractinia symbiolongicarpus]
MMAVYVPHVTAAITFLNGLERNRFLPLNEIGQEIYNIQFDEIIWNLASIYLEYLQVPDISDRIPEVIRSLQNSYEELVKHRCRGGDKSNAYISPRAVTGEVGRPKYEVPKEQVISLKKIGYQWKDIAQMLGISIKTLCRRRKEFDLPFGEAEYSDITDQQLDEIVREVLLILPNCGERMVIGAITSKHIKVKRERLRQSIMRVDALSRVMRRRNCIQRRRYNVKSPNSLWHMDGHHKLIRWRIVFHGCIDGYSRLVTFLRCNSNNRSTTVLDLFLEAINKYNVPRRIRTDHGIENIEVARWMLGHFGVASKPVITGLSMHNQRIERLWRDLVIQVVDYFKGIFYFMEQQEMLDPVNDVDLYALHSVFLPRINRACEEFVKQWNNHPLSTEGNRTPYQLWTQGMYMNWHSSDNGLRQIMEENENIGTHGVELDGPAPLIDSINNVNVPEIALNLPDNFMQNIDPLSEDHNHGINLYIQTRELLVHAL